MNNQTKRVTSIAGLCLAFGEEDGVDPKFLARKAGRKTARYKDLQLGKETSRIVALVLADAVNHPLLSDLQVVSVLPEYCGQHLCVTVGHYGVMPDVTEVEVVAELKRIQGVLRCALAQAINRKRTPMLSFRYVGLIDQAGQIDRGGA